ncbi:response regulator [Pontibacter diazotrophicus]|uniref:Response regulator n=1 Tax=Pontibacter diazotrophicus TaxID=1400979 RepID=A0A3D8LEL3_9BACT|nr:response regulator [Pontibacter diazotrophicus]RDV15840.1 response regulator [Pontibacter diazotrophicus]
MYLTKYYQFIYQAIAPVNQFLHVPGLKSGKKGLKQPKTVLLVDDDNLSIFLSKRVLKMSGIEAEILTAQHGQEALAIIRELYCSGRYPELVLLDINMPVMGGFTLLEELQKSVDWKSSSMRIVILSSSLHDLELARAKELPVVGYIEKPLSKEKLSCFL